MTMKSLRKDEVKKVYVALGFAFAFMALLGALLHLSLGEVNNVRQKRVGIYGGASIPVKEVFFSEGHYAPTARKILTISNTTTTAEDYGGDEGGAGNDNNGGDGGGAGNDNNGGGDGVGAGNDDNGGDESGGGNDSSSGDGPNRVGAGTGATCSKDSILVFQGQTSPLPNGIPTYTVEIQNVCLSESCSISGIHLSCGWFSSVRLINPSVFRRVDYDDCLVNDGKPLNPGESLSFQYANTFKYPLSVSSVSC